MIRAVLDPNVIISSLLSSSGAPAQVVHAWLQGEFDLIVSPLLLSELERALGYPKLRRRIESADALLVLAWLAEFAEVAEDPDSLPSIRSPDPADDYLLALAEHEGAALVSGDGHLLGIRGDLPIFAATAFLEFLRS